MTYVSRRTRIIVSRWLDECDADYRLQASRKRSDGRLKKYSSCDDFRAWVNDNCIKHEYLADLMSNGEFSGRSPFRLYGRFIPVPVLFQLAQGSNTTETNQSAQNQEVNTEAKTTVNVGVNARRSKSATSGEQNEKLKIFDKDTQVTRSINNQLQDAATARSNSNLLRAEWEKNLLEKSLIDCTSLLSKAMSKLEKIDSIVAQANAESDKARTEEIQDAFSKSKLSCSCSANSSSNNGLSASGSYLKKSKESAKCTELLRKISDLREKLKKIQECRREVNQQIQSSKRRYECVSTLQVTELYSRREQAHIKKLQKKLEKLIAERGRLLSEMCQALTSLNNIKKTSKSTMNFPKGDSKSMRTEINEFRCEKLGESAACQCGCQCTENPAESEDWVQFPCTESSSSESEDNNNFAKSKQMDDNFSLSDYQAQCNESANTGNTDTDVDSNSLKDYSNNYPQEFTKDYPQRSSNDCPIEYSKDYPLECLKYLQERNLKNFSQNCSKNNSKRNPKEYSQNYSKRQSKDYECEKSPKGNSDLLESYNAVGSNLQKPHEQQETSKHAKVNDTKGKNSTEKRQETKSGKKSKVKFVCPEPPCRKKLDADDISAFENTLTQEQLCIVSEAVESIRLSRQSMTQNNEDAQNGTSGNAAERPAKSETAKKDREARAKNSGNVLERRVKSETTMKEIEKTLRNYQRRLSELDGIEGKVEEMKEKISECQNLRKRLAKMKAEAKNYGEAEREKSEREISRLCSENWELKRQVQELTAKFGAQLKKIQNLKCGARRARELECQAEDLKKELSEYRDGFEHQRKCISKWESVVAVQRTEIENLMNHIRMLTTMKEEEASNASQERRSIQRSRSYSPEMVKGKKIANRPKTQARDFRRLSDEEGGCCCESYMRQQNGGRMNAQRNFDRDYFPQEWCN